MKVIPKGFIEVTNTEDDTVENNKELVAIHSVVSVSFWGGTRCAYISLANCNTTISTKETYEEVIAMIVAQQE